MKKTYIGVGIILAMTAILITVLLFFVKGKDSQKKVTPTPKPKLSIPANVVPVAERPYIMLSPTAGREVVLEMSQIKKTSESVDYELQYSAGDKEEAVIGSIDFVQGKNDYSRTVLLGSKSGGGKVTYHENVNGGSLVLTFYDENYKLSNEWTYTDNKKPQKSFSSRDVKFAIETEKLLNSSPYVIVYQNAGLPASIEKTLLSGPYSISGTSKLPAGKVKVSMRLSEDKPAEIWGWDGDVWKPFTTTVADKTATAQADLVQTYIAVEK